MTDELDPRRAAALIDATDARTRASLDPRLDLQFLALGAAWVVGFLVLWRDVKDQSPYTGPNAAAFAVFTLLLGAAVITTLALVGRATRGVGGDGARRGNAFGLAWGAALVVVLGLLPALARQGAAPEVVGVVAISGSVGVTGVMYLVGYAIWLERPMLLIGLALVAFGLVAAFSGPVSGLVVAAIGGLALLGCGAALRSTRP